MRFLITLILGLAALAVILGLYATGRYFRTGLEESDWDDTE